MGRTGKLFAYEHYNILPDVMTLAKALGNGFPIGAAVIADKFTKYLPKGAHGSTFGGNHLASRVAFETLKIIMSREILENVEALSQFIFQRLKSIQQTSKVIEEVRGIGLHIGVQLDRPCSQVVESCMKKGLLVNCTSGNTIRIMPPLNISLENVAKGLDIFEESLLELN